MSIGEPATRRDGPAKVTGAARYAADHRIEGLRYAVLVTSTIPAGRVEAIETAAALARPGVERVITSSDMPRLAVSNVPPASTTHMPLQGDEIWHEGQPVAVVVAASLQAAEEGARLVKVRAAPASFVPHSAGPAVAPGPGGYSWGENQADKGDAEAALAAAPIRLAGRYTQPSRHHNPMEPSATIAMWDGGRLTVYDAVQWVFSQKQVLAEAFGLPPENVRVIAHHTGGAFGCKGYAWPHQLIAVAAARLVGRPVKLVLTRAQMYTSCGYQPEMEQEVELGADGSGALAAISHRSINQTSMKDDFVEYATEASKCLYASPAIRLRQEVRRGNVNLPTAMRAPVEGPGSWALGAAMDELAHRLGVDPLDLRLTNYAEVDPFDGKPWSSKKLREAYEIGARAFGWRERPRGGRRDGDWLIGCGMADCTMGAFRFSAQARLRLMADGTARIEAGSADIGTGNLTIFPQIAADALGLPLDRVSFLSGDSELAMAGPTWGSSSTVGTGAAILDAARDITRQLARLANLPPEEAELKAGAIHRRGGLGEGQPITAVMRAAGVGDLVGEGRFAPGGGAVSMSGSGTPYAMRTFGAIFVEVAVDPELGLLRLRRVVGAYSAGRIINPLTARAQMTGGIIWGWGKAAMEQSPYEPTLGRWLSKNLAGVAVPVNADIPEIEVHFVEEVDEEAGPLGAKGIGELGATGVAAAVANAVFDATGKRIRDLPITPAKLVG